MLKRALEFVENKARASSMQICAHTPTVGVYVQNKGARRYVCTSAIHLIIFLPPKNQTPAADVTGFHRTPYVYDRLYFRLGIELGQV